MTKRPHIINFQLASSGDWICVHAVTWET